MTQERHSFTDEQWERIALRLPPCKGRPGGEQRTFFNALLWMARTGAAWRDLPERLGKWNVVYQRYAYWCDKGHFERLFQAVQQPDIEEVMVDSTCCKVLSKPRQAREKQAARRPLASRAAGSIPKSTPSATPWETRCALC